MDFDSLLSPDVRPAPLKLFLHFAPDNDRLVVELKDFLLCGFLELVESELALNDGGFHHEELKLLETRVSFEPAPSGLQLDGGKDWAVRSFVLGFGVVDHFENR